MLTEGEGRAEVESEDLLANILCLKYITLKIPELAKQRKELVRTRLLTIVRIRDARKTGKESELRELIEIHDNLGKKINEIDTIIEKGLDLQSRI
jgi:hypothetical protein